VKTTATCLGELTTEREKGVAKQWQPAQNYFELEK